MVTFVSLCEDCEREIATSGEVDLKYMLTYVAENGHCPCLDILLKLGADVNVCDSAGDTAIIKSAWKGHYDCCKLLIETGADMNIADNHGYTALMLAAWKGHEKCVDLLIKAGANVNQIDTSHNTALKWASTSGKDTCVELLLRAGADVDVVGIDGNPPLLCAALTGHERCLHFLIHAGANVEATNVLTGDKALIKASEQGHHNCLNLLLKAGADVNIIDTNGNTALMGGSHNVNSVRLLLKAGAFINIGNSSYRNALEFCLHLSTMIQSNVSSLTGENKDGKLKSHHLLLAAGEPYCLNKRVIQKYNSPISEFITNITSHGCLKCLCRETIRRHLIRQNEHLHLFGRVPYLGLPSSLTSFLLYDISL